MAETVEPSTGGATTVEPSTGGATGFDAVTVTISVSSLLACFFSNQLLQDRANGKQVPSIFESHPFFCFGFSLINLFGFFTSFFSIITSPSKGARVLQRCSIFFISCAAAMLLAAACWLVFQEIPVSVSISSMVEQGNPAVSSV